MKKTIAVYYKSKLVTVRDSEIKDVFELAGNMRPEDAAEIWKADHSIPEAALMGGYMNSIVCLTIEYNEKAIAMFGIVAKTILGRVATVWLLASTDLEKIQKVFLRYSRYFIEMMLGFYPLLINYVDIENKKAIKWLTWCGAEFGPVVPYGIEKQPFQYFQFRRS